MSSHQQCKRAIYLFDWREFVAKIVSSKNFLLKETEADLPCYLSPFCSWWTSEFSSWTPSFSPCSPDRARGTRREGWVRPWIGCGEAGSCPRIEERHNKTHPSHPINLGGIRITKLPLANFIRQKCRQTIQTNMHDQTAAVFGLHMTTK